MKVTNAQVVGRLTSRLGYDMRHRTESDRVKKSAAKLARRSCSTYANGACLLNDGPCNYETDAPLACVRCPFFEGSVLPMDSSLVKEYHNVLSGEDVKPVILSECVRCGDKFGRRSNRSKYCESCKLYAKRKRDREYRARKRTE